ncbi:ABC transporter ATP-binding protein [Spirochaetota bacterium]|nr:ABC transporter ATP-binding protein [Spirochaetota bacterium]
MKAKKSPVSKKSPSPAKKSNSRHESTPILSARKISKRFGHVTALADVDFDLYAGEVLAIIGDNGAGKSTLIKILSGAIQPDKGTIYLNQKEVSFHSPIAARKQGIETVYQDLAVAPALNIVDNLFLGREILKPGPLGTIFRMRDKSRMLKLATEYMRSLKIGVHSLEQEVATLSGGQRQAVAVCRSAAFAKHFIIMDEPTAALGLKEAAMVIDLIKKIREQGLSIVVISHNMPQVFEIADRIHIQRLGRRVGVISPKTYSMSDVVAFMTGSRKILT